MRTWLTHNMQLFQFVSFSKYSIPLVTDTDACFESNPLLLFLPFLQGEIMPNLTFSISNWFTIGPELLLSSYRTCKLYRFPAIHLAGHHPANGKIIF